MNREANNIIGGMKAMARGQARSNMPQIIKWRSIICRYHPSDDRAYWSTTGSTKLLSRRQVTSLINIELADCAAARKQASGTENPAEQPSMMMVD
jgi:hypothetical protein